MFVSGSLILFISLLTCLLLVCLAIITALRNTEDHSTPPSRGPKAPEARFLFRAGTLVDANTAARQMCAETPGEIFDWIALRGQLAPRFPDFPSTQGASVGRDLTVYKSKDPSDHSVVTLDQWDNVARVILAEDDMPNATRRTAILQAMFQAPNPIWKTDEDGRVVWRNAAYKTLGAMVGRPPKGPPLFNVRDLNPGDTSKRYSIEHTADDKSSWFDVTAVQVGEYVMYYASSADAVVSALDLQRSFVQTFSKTFAQLDTGLAIFDRTHELALFNPALTELTGLSADFLSRRCGLTSFFDRLREKSIMPEPKNYASWRDQIAAVVRAANDGHYTETWALASGVTYRVTGRPHPDGSIAFLFEDITAELSITRRFRTELERCHHVLDCMDTALALFSSTGQLHLCNQAYRTLWKSDPDSSFADYTLRDAVQLWKSECQPSALWDELHDRTLHASNHRDWSGNITMKETGLQVIIRASPAAGGATLLRFEAANARRTQGVLRGTSAEIA